MYCANPCSLVRVKTPMRFSVFGMTPSSIVANPSQLVLLRDMIYQPTGQLGPLLASESP